MNRRICIVFSLVFFLCVSSFLGCGGGAEEAARRKISCQRFGLQYLDFQMVNQRSPKDADELQAFKTPTMSSEDPIFKKIEDAEVVVVWNAFLVDSENPGGKYVLAYEKSTPDSGGLVVMGNAAVDRVSAEEFAKMELMPTAEELPALK